MLQTIIKDLQNKIQTIDLPPWQTATMISLKQIFLNYRSFYFDKYSDQELTLMAVISILVTNYIYGLIVDYFVTMKKRGYLRLMQCIPILKNYLQKEIDMNCESFKKGLPKTFVDPIEVLPEQGWKKQDIVEKQQKFAEEETSIKKPGKYTGGVYSLREDIIDISKIAASNFLFSNMIFFAQSTPSRLMENEVISWVKKLLNGDENTTGCTTTGGSESIFMGVQAHKRYYFKVKGIKKPEIIMSETAHPAFMKACQFLDIKPVLVPLDKKTLKVSPKQFQKKVNQNTICLVGSSPNMVYGYVDPLEELGKIAGKYNIGFFIDGCMGSFLLPFVDDFGIQTGEKYCDLRVPNVTCMSCDPHKYGMTAKGLSVLLFKNPQIQKSMYFGTTDHLGGLYGTQLIAGSRGGHIIAAGWACMMLLGRNGYKESAKKIFDTTKFVTDSLADMKGFIKVVGNPKLGNVTIVSDNAKINMYDIGNCMSKKGWALAVGLGIPSLQITIHPHNSGNMENFVKEIKDSINQIILGKHDVKEKGSFKIYGDISGIPTFISSTIVEESQHGLYDINALKH